MKSGTFKSDISGTFVSDTSGTFGVIYSIKDTYILSGINPNGKIFYQKMVFNKNKDIFYMLLLEYPDNSRKKGDEIIKTSISPFPKRQDGSDVEPELEENTEQQL